MANPARTEFMKTSESHVVYARMLLFVVFIFFTGKPAGAQNPEIESTSSILSVSGTATTSVDPDLLVVGLGVETQEKTAQNALRTNSQLVSSVVDAILSVGLTKEELSTSGLSVHPIYVNQKSQLNRYKQVLIGYRVVNSLTVKTKKLDLVALIIDKSVSSGANKVNQVYFTLSPESQLHIKDSLLEKAVQDAKAKAEKVLTPLDHKIIGVKHVSLSQFNVPPPVPVYAQQSFDSPRQAASAPTPIFSSKRDVTTTVSVVFFIGKNSSF